MTGKFRGLILLTFLLTLSSCVFQFPPKVLEESKHISNFAIDNNHLYFGAGYHLYRVNLSTRASEVVVTTKSILVEQPVIADGVAYFGGRTYVDKNKWYGEDQGLFALNLESRKVVWKFPLGIGGYGTYGTYPVVAGDYILVCARQHLHCLERRSGKEVWNLNNWFGRTSDGVNIPYVHANHVYFKISEEYFTKSYDIDGHWAKVALSDGTRVAVMRIAETPGKYHDMGGEGISQTVDGVVYGALRYDRNNYPNSRFGALSLETQEKLWEVAGGQLRTKPAVNDKFVFTVIDNAIHALSKKTGSVVWKEPLGAIAETPVYPVVNRQKQDLEYEWGKRLVATNEVVVVHASSGLVARSANDGKFLWEVKTEPAEGHVDPIILDQIVVAASLKDCSIFALDLKTGRELWRSKLPDCTYYVLLDD